MDAVTYPAEEVINFIHKHLIPLRININNNSAIENHHIFWTPCLAVIDMNGNEMQRTIGFLGVEEFIPSMLLGLAKERLNAGEYEMAMIPLTSLQEMFFESDMIPEAIYFSGVAMYKQTSNAGRLKEAYEKLLKDHPESVWTRRAYPYRLL